MTRLINIVGNMASGKSTFLNQLRVHLPHFEVYQIDELRKQHPKRQDPYLFNIVGERLLAGQSVLFEHCGTNDAWPFWHKILAESPNIKMTYFYLACQPDVCFARYISRPNNPPGIINPASIISEINRKLFTAPWLLHDPLWILDEPKVFTPKILEEIASNYK